MGFTNLLCVEFINELGWAEIISIVSVAIVITGGVISLVQWAKKQSLKRADYINELTEKIRTDKDIRQIVYLMDYNDKEWYDLQFHESGDLERQVDKTLSLFSYICYLKQEKLITQKELKFFIYELDRILRNYQVQSYLFNLYHFAQQFLTPCTFHYLIEYGKKNLNGDSNNYLNSEFFNKQSTKYPHYLNF